MEGALYKTPLEKSVPYRWLKVIIFFVLIVLGMSIMWFLVNSLAFGMDQGVDKGYATIGLALGGHEGLLRRPETTAGAGG